MRPDQDFIVRTGRAGREDKGVTEVPVVAEEAD